MSGLNENEIAALGAMMNGAAVHELAPPRFSPSFIVDPVFRVAYQCGREILEGEGRVDPLRVIDETASRLRMDGAAIKARLRDAATVAREIDAKGRAQREGSRFPAGAA